MNESISASSSFGRSVGRIYHTLASLPHLPYIMISGQHAPIFIFEIERIPRRWRRQRRRRRPRPWGADLPPPSRKKIRSRCRREEGRSGPRSASSTSHSDSPRGGSYPSCRPTWSTWDWTPGPSGRCRPYGRWRPWYARPFGAVWRTAAAGGGRS